MPFIHAVFNAYCFLLQTGDRGECVLQPIQSVSCIFTHEMPCDKLQLQILFLPCSLMKVKVKLETWKLITCQMVR